MALLLNPGTWPVSRAQREDTKTERQWLAARVPAQHVLQPIRQALPAAGPSVTLCPRGLRVNKFTL